MLKTRKVLLFAMFIVCSLFTLKTKANTYSAVNLKNDDLADKCTESKKFYQFKYTFANWDDGSMVAPNIGLVRE